MVPCGRYTKRHSFLCPLVCLERFGQRVIHSMERSRALRTSNQLRRTLAIAALTFLIALLAMTVSTFAWYIYNTTAHTTQVKMVAGSSVSLQIANASEGPYSSSAVMESFTGRLNPVSTDKISGGFQRAEKFAPQASDNRFVASIFGGAEDMDFYKTSLYLRTNNEKLDIYLSDIGFEDASEAHPLSTAIRLGIVAEGREYIFAINTQHNPNADDNAATEKDGGYVLDSSKTDGTTLPFVPYAQDNYCVYDRTDGSVTLKENSVRLCTVTGGGADGYGQPVKLDIYLWLEGCDEDCTLNLVGQSLQKLSLSFAGLGAEGA